MVPFCALLVAIPFGGESCTSRPRFVPAEGALCVVGPTAGRPVVGDMNGDGRADVVVACAESGGLKPEPTGALLFVLLGRGDGTLKPAPGSPLKVGASMRKVALGDVNEDGRLDVVAVEHDSCSVHVFLGDAQGGLALAPGSPFTAASGVRPHTHEVATADVNGDRHVDLLTTNAAGNSISVLLGDGKAEFAPAQGSPFAAGNHPYDSLALADLSGDGALDLVVPNLHGDRITVLIGDGSGAFNPARKSPFAVGPRPGCAALIDLDGRAGLEIVATHDDDALLAVLVSDGEGGFYQGKGGLIELPERAWGIAAGDLDGDGRADLVLGTHAQRGPLLLYSTGDGGLSAPQRVETPRGKGGSHVALADFDGDRKLDLVTSNYDSGDLTIYLSRPPAK